MRYGKRMSVMAKITDDLEGDVFVDGRINKPYTKKDIYRLQKGSTTPMRTTVVSSTYREHSMT